MYIYYLPLAHHYLSLRLQVPYYTNSTYLTMILFHVSQSPYETRIDRKGANDSFRRRSKSNKFKMSTHSHLCSLFTIVPTYQREYMIGNIQ